VIDDCEFAFTVRDDCPDGTGWDFEGDCDDMRFFNNVLHDNDGAGILTMSTVSDNLHENIVSNTFYNNCRNPNNSDNNYELKSHNSGCTGWVIGNGIYRGSATDAGTPGYISSKWTGHIISDNRQLLYPSVSGRQKNWEFNTEADFEGWSDFNQWSSPTVSGGSLNGVSSGNDPYVHSSDTWINTHEYRFIRTRMSVSAGNNAQIFFITETDGAWNQDKSMSFALNADGEQHEYVLDMRSLCPDYKGVITKIRLDPTDITGSDISVDYVRFSTN